jgi:ubiquinone/menaquinone biosynthesis C-methylase UbiE
MEVPNFWDNMAKRYPRFDDTSMCQDVNRILDWCRSLGVSFEGKRILDIGAGTGTIAIPLAQQGAFLTAIDVSQSMLEHLKQDAKALSLDSRILIYHSDWETFPLTESYDFVIASMTPAISNEAHIDKMLSAARSLGLYVGWGAYRNNDLVKELLEAHHYQEKPCEAAGCMNTARFIDVLKQKHIAFHYAYFETSWTDAYDFEAAKEYAYDQLRRKSIIPDERSVEAVLKRHIKNKKVQVTTKAEKGMVLWNVTE